MTEFGTLGVPIRRFGRRSIITILDGTVAIKTIHGFDQTGSDPFGLRLSFNIERKLTAIADFATIRIWNLNAESRGMLAQRSLATLTGLGIAPATLRYVRVEAGYEDSTGIIFHGAIVRAINIREGADWITEMTCSSAYGQALLNTLEFSWGTPTPVKTVVDALFGAAWPGSTVTYTSEALKELRGKLVNSKAVEGSAYIRARRMLNDFGLEFNVDVDGVTVYKKDFPRDPVNPNVPYLPLDETTGLIGTPKISDVGTEFKTFLDSRIRPGLLVQIDSESLRASLSDPSLGRNFTVMEVLCVGDTHSDDWFSEVPRALFFPPVQRNALNTLAPQPLTTTGGV